MKLIRATLFLLLVIIISCKEPSDKLYSIPFTIEDEWIILKISINDTDSINAVFDTGANALMLEKRIADKIRFSETRTATIMGNLGKDSIIWHPGTKVGIGMKTIDSTDVVVGSLDHMSMYHDFNVDAFIGSSFLYNSILEINYEEMMIHGYRKLPATADYQELPVRIEKEGDLEDIPFVTGNVFSGNNGISCRMIFDTGAGVAMVLSDDFCNAHNIPDQDASQTESIASGMLTKGASVKTHIRYMLFGKQGFKNIPVSIVKSNSGLLSYGTADALLGNSILKRFNHIIDYENELFFVKPNSLFDTEFITDNSGLVLRYKDMEKKQIVIEKIAPGSPAVALGITPESELISLNGIPAIELKLKGIKEILRKKSGTVTIEVGTDSIPIEYTLNLKEYY